MVGKTLSHENHHCWLKSWQNMGKGRKLDYQWESYILLRRGVVNVVPSRCSWATTAIISGQWPGSWGSWDFEAPGTLSLSVPGGYHIGYSCWRTEKIPRESGLKCAHCGRQKPSTILCILSRNQLLKTWPSSDGTWILGAQRNENANGSYSTYKYQEVSLTILSGTYCWVEKHGITCRSVILCILTWG